jgi:hypothetical protein
MKSERILERVEKSYEKYGWTEEQKGLFEKFTKDDMQIMKPKKYCMFVP